MNKPKTISNRARSLRQTSTKAERILWSVLRDRRLGGLKFRRQHAIVPYVVDFFCHEVSLIIELDGESHMGRVQQDRNRDEFLTRKGFCVIRIPNPLLMTSRDAVAEYILDHAGLDPAILTQSPSPCPLPEGEGT